MKIVLRSLGFALALLALLFPFMGVMALLFLLPMETRYRLAVWWARYVIMPVVSGVAGIRYRVQGAENVPADACVILSKHQSAWETIAFLDIFPPITYVLKRELLWIPFFGWGLARMPIVSIDRSAGKDALRQVVERGQQRADVTAIGTMGVPAMMARRDAPDLYSPFCPRAARVPSGNMITQLPCPISRLPCASTFAQASLRRLRSMWIMSMRPMAQPKNGIHSSSRLNT